MHMFSFLLRTPQSLHPEDFPVHKSVTLQLLLSYKALTRETPSNIVKCIVKEMTN